MASMKKSGGGSGTSAVAGGVPGGVGVGTPTRRNSQVRSPCIKRLPQAPVTLQGWLHKQGSDGLMLWKKRWFVLSDYCLFYYKGQEEEKLLGSILLPSYRISPCSSEDKVYRKFSFKAEHANMRTYYFAADTHQQMAQWMNALSLASILQDSGNWDENRTGGSTNRNNNNNNNNQTNSNACDDSDSGFQVTNQRLQPHQNYNDVANPTTDHAANFNSWQNCHNMQLPPGYQPLYANAPPKPRRLNDSSSTERSPERLHEEVGGRTSRMGAQPQEYNRNYNGSINVQYNAQHSHHRTVNNLYVINNNINSNCNPSNVVANAQQLNNSERRTPDTYGRSNNATPCAQQAVIRVNRPKQHNPDYEDVYQNNPDLVINTNHHRVANTMPYAAVNHQVQYRRKQNIGAYHTVAPESVEERQRRFAVRPHSADFLEYDAARYYSPSSDSSNVYDGRPAPQTQTSRGRVTQKPRPKSSMEIAHPSEGGAGYNGVDGQHWSEEGYARKMRQSASFVAPQMQVPNSSSRATTPSLKQVAFPGTSNPFPYDGASYNGKPSPQQGSAYPYDGTPYNGKPSPQQGSASNTFPYDGTYNGKPMPQQGSATNTFPYDASYNGKPMPQQGSATNTFPYDGTSYNGKQMPQQGSVAMRGHCEVIERQERKWNEYVESRGTVPFVRSASARLARQLPDEDFLSESPVGEVMDSGQMAFKRRNSTEPRESGTKIQQREESMKRLLEWKQRMLQSPLTRKNSGSSSGGRTHQELKHYKQQMAHNLNSNDSAHNLTSSMGHPSKDSAQTMDWLTVEPGQQQRAVSTMPELRSSRRKDDQAHLAPGSSRSASTRSRSQDGRRSASLANRYTSYSSDDEEVQEARESWKRTRRLSQQQSKTGQSDKTGQPDKTGRPDNWDSKQGNYENLELARPVDISSTNQKSRIGDSKLVSFERSRTMKSLTNTHELSPGSDVGSFQSESKSLQNYDGESSKNLVENNLEIGGDLLETSPENLSFLHSQHNSNCQQIFSSKHSDSGYDTLKTGPTMSSDPEVRDLLKFRFDKSQTMKDVTVYPVQVKQGKPDTSKEPWQTKLDESRLIKEFSYQYIKLGKDDGGVAQGSNDGSPPQNLVQHRIKTFEGSGEDDKEEKKDGKLKMQDPLRVTSPVYHPNEAHVSMLRSTDSLTPSPCDLKQSTQESTNLRRMRRTSLHGFALGDATLALDEDAKIVLEEERFAKKSNPKSVRDLLADFEKKSQLAKEQLAAEERSSEESPGKRCVFSDTETLLYDTSSDAECHSNSGSVLSKIRRPEMLVSEDDEEDRDEEVAAALGKRDTFFSACRDLGRKNEASAKQKSKADTIDQSYLDSNGYKRLSVADSMITHEDLESHCSSPKTAPKRAPSSLNIVNVNAVDVLEEHYMPMTPSKKSVLAPPTEGGLVAHTRSNSASQTMIMENLLVNEESSYVEMTENGMIRSLLAPESSKKFATKSDLQRMASNTSNTDSACYTEIDQAAKMSSPLSAHYELLYRSGATSNSQTEPLYMEVNSLPSDEKCLETSASQERSEKLSQESLNKREEAGDGSENPHPVSQSRAALPDILNSSTNVSNQKQSSIKSDSSDADDEASKDLDSLDAPRHPRFSLSDTFRPASYYLGASMVERTLVGMNSEQQDSSDSDLVSPPPIPTSPPPMDDLETSLDSTIDLKKSSPLHMKNDKQDSADRKDLKLWNSTLSHSDDTITEHMDKYFSASISRLDETVSSETDSIESCRRDRLKRRPVSADVLHSLNRPYDLLDLDDGMNVDLDQYLADLNLMSEVSHNMPLNPNHRLYQSEKYLPGDISSHSAQNAGSVNSYQIDSDEVQYENLQLMYPQPPPTSNSLDELSIEHDVDNDTYITLENPMNLSETMVMPRGAEENQEGAVDQSGAPYYYADLLKGDPNAVHIAAENINILAHNSSQVVRNPRVGSMLNNQRESPVEIICSNKRNDVGRKVNPIHGAVGSAYPELEEMDDATRLALELRNSARFLSDKSEFVDERNLYESNTLRRKTVSMSGGDYRSQTPDALGNTNSHNIYPHGIRDKDVSGKQSSTTRRRSRSLEGLLDEPDFQIPPEPSRSTRVSPGNAISRLLQTTRPQTQTMRTSAANIPQNIASSSRAQAPPPPPDVWEEDTLWRENLRRASLRHTRSLDDLDRDTPTAEEAPAVPKHQQVSPQQQQPQQVPPHQQRIQQVSSSQQYQPAPTHQQQHPQYQTVPQNTQQQQVLPHQQNTQKVPLLQQYQLNTHQQVSPHQKQVPSHQQYQPIQSHQQVKPQPPPPNQQQSSPPQNPNCKLSRDVTYVNDSVMQRRVNHREYEEDYREGRSKMATSRQAAPDVERAVADDGDDALYERLVREPGQPQPNVVGDAGRAGVKPVAVGGNSQPQPFLDIGWYPTRPPSTFEIDREKLRQWDLMSSAPSGMVGAGGRLLSGGIPAKNQVPANNHVVPVPAKNQVLAVPANNHMVPVPAKNQAATVPANQQVNLVGIPDRNPPDSMVQSGPRPVVSTVDPARLSDLVECHRQQDLPPNSSQASGSGSVIGRDPLPPRTIIDKQPNGGAGPPHHHLNGGSQSQRAMSPSPLYTPPPGPIMRQPEPDLSHKRIDGPCSWNLQMSAGELLGRTHEELVLLLIQLRRQSAGFCKAMEGCHIEIEAQARLAELETPKRMEHLQKLEDLKRHLLELEKQYEKGKPLVNLVDNMVKLGSLYRAGSTSNGLNSPSTVNLNSPLFRERLEFNHKVQEQRLLAEERKDWDRLSPDHNQLQAKVAQLYRLDKLLQEESGTLHSLQQDKEMLEQALGGLRHKLQVIDNNPVEAERYRKQQRLLERELTRVRSILAHNSKKLEETVAENARLEQELVVLRQKVQTSRRIPDPATGPTTAALEAELRRVQTLVGDLQRQRHELSVQVRQLTDKSRTLSQQIRPGPTGVAGAGALAGKKPRAAQSSWLETDLDSHVTRDLGLDSAATSPTPSHGHHPPPPPPPLYVNTDADSSAAVSPTNVSSSNSELASRDDISSTVPSMATHQMQYCRPMDISEADDRIKRFYGIIPKDKPQEIKTVRIVKRESERRQRDRDRSGNIGIPLTNNMQNKRLPYLDEYGGSYGAEQQQQMTTSSSSSSSMTSSVTSVLTKVMEEHEPSSHSSSLAPPPPPPAPMRTDSVNAIRNMVNRQQIQLAKNKLDQPLAMSNSSSSGSNQLSAAEQLFGPTSPQLTATEQLFGPSSPQLSPVYQSEAARQIIEEMSANKVTNKRLVPREKRRHHTVSGRPLFRIDTSHAAGGSRDDLDMERALRPRLNAPDVVRSTLSRTDTKFSSETIDNLLGTPNKILIPERYVPETSPELTVEEQAKRSKKADAIRKMLSETTTTGTIVTQEAGSTNEAENELEEEEKSSTLKKKVQEEKRQREHFLQLNQILAQQVMEKSKIVAGSTPNISSPSSCSPGSANN